VKLSYTITSEDRRQGRRIYDSALAPMRWLTGIEEPFSFAALGFGIYCYAIGNRALAFSLFASFGYLFSKGFLLRFIRDFLASRRRSEPEHFQLETSSAGINFSVIGGTRTGGLASSQKSWLEFRRYCHTPDMVVLSLGRTFYVIPKRSLTAAEISEFQSVLSAKLSQATVRTGILAVRHAISVVLLGYIAFFFFGGTIEQAWGWLCVRFNHGKPFGILHQFGFLNLRRAISCMAWAKFIWSRSEIRRR